MRTTADLIGEILGVALGLAICFCWLAGIVLAKGFFSTAFSCIMPPYAFYLVVEHFLK